MYSPELVTGKTSRGLSGRFNATEALRRLLTGSGLEAQDAGDSTFTLRSEEHTSELQSLMRISYAVFCLKKTTHTTMSGINLIRTHRPTARRPKLTTHTAK